MFEKLNQILSAIEADYADLRYELKHLDRIIVSKREVQKVSSSSSDGFVLRVLKNGGLATVTFTKEGDAPWAVKKALENAEVLARENEKPVELEETEVIKDSFSPPLGEDPRDVPLSEKIELVKRYSSQPLSHPEIASTNTSYEETIREKYFVSSEGSKIHEDLITVQLLISIIAGREGLTQSVRYPAGGSDGFQIVRDQEKQIEDYTNIAIQLLDAQPVKAGVYDCILDPIMAGVFTHEAFGHFSEGDLIENLPALLAKMQIGAKLGSDLVNIKDDATIRGEISFYKYDDEGVPVRPVQLMKNGVLTGRLHSRKTAASFQESLTGHAIAQDYRFEPMVRMGCIFIEPGESGFDDLINTLQDGLYLIGSNGGETAGDTFTFSAMYGYLVKDGKIQEMIRDINISGDLFTTLRNITAVGNVLRLNKRGGCGKGSQMNPRSCLGAPHVLIKDLVVGGS